MPRLIVVCDYGYCGSAQRWLTIVRQLANCTLSPDFALQVRIKNIEDSALQRLAALAREAIPDHCLAMLNGNVNLANKLGYSGVHLPHTDHHQVKSAGSMFNWVSLAVHHENELALVNRHPVSWIVVSPIFQVHWKTVQPLGATRLRSFVKQSNNPVYAQGGVNHDNAGACVNTGARGIAVLSNIMNARDPIATVQQFLKVLPSETS